MSDSMAENSTAEQIELICAGDPRFRPEAYCFVIAALEVEMLRLEERRHLSGQELAHGIRRLALENYGLMARSVLEAWGCRTTDDFGSIVYNLISARLFTKTPEDSIDDFHAVYDFHEAFNASYEPGPIARETA